MWRTNATIVVASYKYRFDWLKNIPPTFDVAIYDKFDFANASRLAGPMASMMAGKGLSHRRVNHVPGGHTDDLARLTYYRVLPNYGRTDPRALLKHEQGGSREPYPYLQFILDFWHNLPNVLIFTQAPTYTPCMPHPQPAYYLVVFACLPAIPTCPCACPPAHRSTALGRHYAGRCTRCPGALRCCRTGEATGGRRKHQRGEP